MENQEEKKGIKVIISYEQKRVAMRVEHPKKGIKYILDEIKKKARNNPDKLWHLPEMDNGGNRVRYYLGRKNETGKDEILKETNANREEQSLYDYKVKDGDELVIIKKVIAG